MPKNMRKNLSDGMLSTIRAIALILLLNIFGACKSYHLGSPFEIPFESIYITPVSNHSYAPQAQAITSAMLRENFIRDARAKVVSKKEDADAILLVDLTNYERTSTARNQQDTGIADSFDVSLKADISLLNQKTGAYLFENHPVLVTTNTYTSNPYEDDSVIAYQLSERQAMEQLSRELARKVTNLVLSPW